MVVQLTERNKNRNVLFNDALNTYGYIELDMWQRTTEIAREETRCRHYMGYSFRYGIFYIHHPTDRIEHDTAFIIAVVEH